MFTEAPERPRSPLDRVVRALDAALTPHGVDRYLELVDPTWSTREVRARVVGVRRQTADTVTLTLRPNRQWRGFVAGQHTQVTVEIDGVRHTRCFSLAGSAHGHPRRDGTIELTVKTHPAGFVSRHLVDHAARGDIVALSPARGSFVVPGAPGDRPAHLLFVSGGSGITPVLSMLRTLCDEGHRGPMTFLHYALTAESMLYRSELALLEAQHPGLRVVRVFTDEPGVGDLDGFLTASQLDAADPAWRRAEVFVCGPPPLLRAATAAVETAGRGAHLHTERYTLDAISPTADAGGTVALRRACLALANDGRPLLLQVEDAGLQPDSGCRMGICHTCTRHLTRGTVRDVVTGTTTTAHPGETDTDVRLCVSAPVGDVEIDL